MQNSQKNSFYIEKSKSESCINKVRTTISVPNCNKIKKKAPRSSYDSRLNEKINPFEKEEKISFRSIKNGITAALSFHIKKLVSGANSRLVSVINRIFRLTVLQLNLTVKQTF